MESPRRRGIALALIVLPLVAATAAAQTPLPVDPAIRTGRLANGLTYYVRANTRPADRAELRLVVNAGSVLEDDDQLGLAHFAEHMAFNGTEGFAKQEIVSYLESIGMRFGADANAYTSFDETVYELTVPTDTGTALDTGLRILEEWAHRVTFDSTEIEKERGVVIEEWRLGRGAATRMRDQSFPVLFRGSRYAERLPIGTRESLETFSRDRLVDFYRTWYRPDLMAVVAVGDFDAAQIEERLRQLFGGIPEPDSARERPVEAVPPREAPDVVVTSDPEAARSIIRVYVLRPRSNSPDEAGYRRRIVESLFDGMLNARLSELAESPDPPFALGVVSTGALVRSRGAVVATAVVPDGEMTQGLDALLTEVERVRRYGFTATELEREKSDLLRAYDQAFQERENTESSRLAAEYVRAFLDGEAIPGIGFEYQLVQRLLPGISIEEVNALAQEVTNERDRVIVAESPESARPQEAPLLAVVDSVQARTIEPYRDRVATTPLVAEPPAPGEVADSRDIPEIEVTEWRLSNSIRVVLKNTDFKADEVVMQAFSPGGLSLAPDSIILSASLADAIVSQSGVGDRSLAELRKELAGNTARVTPFIGELEEGFEGSASPRDLETMLQLTWLYITSPRADSSSFLSMRDRLRTLLANQDVSPDAAFADTVRLTLAQHHPRARPLTPESLDEWDLETSFAFYRERFSNMSDWTFVFVGAFDPDTLRPMVERWIGGLPASGNTESWRDTGIHPPAGVVEKEVRKGIEPRAQTLLVFTGSAEYVAEERHRIGSVADVLDIRLRESLREDLGGTYGASVSGAISRAPDQRFTFQIGFGAEPERLDELVEATFTEIGRLQAQGPDSATLAKVKETQRREWQTDLRENAFWLAQLARAARDDADARGILEFPARVEALTAEAVRDAAVKYLPRDRYVRVSLRPAPGT